MYCTHWSQAHHCLCFESTSCLGTGDNNTFTSFVLGASWPCRGEARADVTLLFTLDISPTSGPVRRLIITSFATTFLFNLLRPDSGDHKHCIFPFSLSVKPAAPNFSLSSFIPLPCCDTESSNSISHHDHGSTQQVSMFLLSSSHPALPVTQLAFIYFLSKGVSSHTENGDSKFEKSDVGMELKWKDEQHR